MNDGTVAIVVLAVLFVASCVLGWIRGRVSSRPNLVRMSSADHRATDPHHRAVFSATVMALLCELVGSTGLMASDDLAVVQVLDVVPAVNGVLAPPPYRRPPSAGTEAQLTEGPLANPSPGMATCPITGPILGENELGRRVGPPAGVRLGRRMVN